MIAALFADALVAFPPLPPAGVTVLDPAEQAETDAPGTSTTNPTSAISTSNSAFNRKLWSTRLDTAASYFTFTLFPFLPQLYFRLQTVDRGGRAQRIFPAIPAAVNPSAPSRP